MAARKTGTREWSDISLNVGTGCKHRCLYCYACQEALRYGTILSGDAWGDECPLSQEALLKRLARLAKKGGKTIMLPTTHDITEVYLPSVLLAAKYVMEHTDHRLLLVSKPDPGCVEELCRELEPYRDRIVLRFTVGTCDPEVSAFWEPGAPLPEERIAALRHAYEHGFTTSVSMEPVLGGIETVQAVVGAVTPWVNDVIWVGWLNKGAARLHPKTPENLARFEREIASVQTDAAALELYRLLRDDPKIRWKDSILQALERSGLQVVNPPNPG